MGRPKKNPDFDFNRVCENCGAGFVVIVTVSPSRFCSRPCYWESLKRDRVPLADRFWTRIQKSDGCWEWTGVLNEKGYGHLWVREEQRQVKVNRVSWMLHHGPIPDGMFVCHTCDNPRCVRPDHLFLGSNRDNMADCAEKNRTCHGVRNAHAKLTEQDVRDIRARYAEGGITMDAIGKAYGVRHGIISGIVRRTRWRRVT